MLLLDEGESGAGADRAAADTSLSSAAAVFRKRGALFVGESARARRPSRRRMRGRGRARRMPGLGPGVGEVRRGLAIRSACRGAAMRALTVRGQ